MVIQDRERACSSGNYNSSCHFGNKTIRGQLDLLPSHAPFFPKFSDQNFEIAIWISIVETSNNHASGDDTALQVFGGRVVSYEIFWLFTCGICYWEFNSHSEERVIFLRGELFPLFMTFHEERCFWGWTFKGKLYTGEFTRILIRKSFYLTYFLFANSILYLKVSQGNGPGKIFEGVKVVWGYFRGGGNFLQRKFSMEEFYTKETFHCRHWVGKNSKKSFARWEDFWHNFKKH